MTSGPGLEWQIGRYDQAGAFIGPADHLEQEFRPGLRERHISQLVEHNQMQTLQLFLEALELPLLSFL